MDNTDTESHPAMEFIERERESILLSVSEPGVIKKLGRPYFKFR
jgi:hypothetical protein